MLRWTMLIAIIAILTAPAVMAQQPQPPQQPPPAQPPRPAEPAQQPKAEAEMAFTGEIVSVDVEGKSLTVKEVPPAAGATPPAAGQQPAGKTLTLTLDASTKITSKADAPATAPAAPGQAAGKTLEVKDLKAGDRVMIKYVADAGKNKAKSIEVTRKPTS